MYRTMICEHLLDKGQRIKTRRIQSTVTSFLEGHANLSRFPLLSCFLSLCFTQEGDINGTGLSSEQRQEIVNEDNHLYQHIATGNL